MGISHESMDKIRTAGLVTKGIVYALVGVLTAMSAFRLGGETTGARESLSAVKSLPNGEIIVFVLALGLLAYSVWRFFKAAADPENKGNDVKGVFLRIGYFLTAIAYAALSIFGFKLSLTNSSGSGDGGRSSMASGLLQTEYGPWLLGAAAVALLIAGIYQFYKGISGKFLKKIDKPSSDEKVRKTIKLSGLLGFCARGVVFGIMAWFFYQAAVQENASKVIDTKGVFQYIGSIENGNILLGVVAIGFFLYGLFNFFVARYSSYTRLS